ncbi:MAG: DRTGG domain-containing protein [Acutalibacteraceae bacterium]|jgi:serine kinase of HPr protein (carbohydrate metabolism regulator)|nr:AraC family transcriptional regulator [Clostridia bacterium]MEE0980950.1 DRTGG domain-containing protein [Acutalibacteraceae bacterium]
MDVKNLVEELGLKVLCGENLEREISGCYCGDLLSWVMSRANEGDVWLTVMGNINSVGVAVLADVACIVLTENAALDEDALKRAMQNDVIILQTDKNSYQMAAAISKLI